jgi:hypothetical protein
MAHDYYSARIDSIVMQQQTIQRRSRNLTLWRGLTALPAVVLAGYWWASDATNNWGYWIAGGLLAGFVILVGVHERLLELAAMLQLRREINEQHLARWRRDWSRLPVPVVDVPHASAAEAGDLDLFGRASVFHWLCQAHTPMGIETLRDWLITPAPPAEVAKRQRAVQRLAGETALREELQLRGQLLMAGGKGPREFLAWAESPGWLASRPILKWSARLLSVAMLLLIGCAALSSAKLAAVVGIGLLLVVNTLLNLGYVPAIHRVFDIVASRHNDVKQYRAALALLRELPTDCEKLTELVMQLGHDADEPLRLLDNLDRRVQLASARHSSIWGLPYLLLQWFLLGDFHVLGVIESWQRKHGRHARQWFAALAELEAIASLAAVAHDNPRWAYADVADHWPTFDARRLGHPLLRDEVRVTNDVEIGPAGTFLLVSGSNMSGKSTLLRSVGVNALLAQAGSPVCAQACNLPRLQVATSMRIGDSLADGVSFYMAELRRLKQIVDLADQTRSSPLPTVLYLLDEILLGTNSTERHIAVTRVIRRLLDSGAIGAVSTHDLQLATSPELHTACRPVHFCEQFVEREGKSEMTFDYRMRPGVATTTNAIKLLEMVGLG